MKQLQKIMANLKKQERQRNENLFIEDTKNAGFLRKGDTYRASVGQLKSRCKITDNGKEGIRDYTKPGGLCDKFYKRTGAKLEVYSSVRGVKDLPVDKIDKAREKRLAKLEKISQKQVPIPPLQPIINNTTIVGNTNVSNSNTGPIIAMVLGALAVGTIIGYHIRKRKEKKDKKKEEDS